MFLKKNIWGLSLILIIAVQFVFWYGIRIPLEDKVDAEPKEQTEAEKAAEIANGKPKQYKVIWRGTKTEKPNMYVVPPVPSEEILRAFSLGDEQLYFRYNAYLIQFAGDTFGRTTALKDYNYEKLYDWWTILDRFDSVSDYQPYMVSYYYGATQDPKRQIKYVIDFLEQHADKHPEKKWWWYSQAAYHARFRLMDDARASEIADKLYNLPKDLRIPIWTRQLKAFILEKHGEYKESCDIIVNILKDYQNGNLEEGEINFIYYFVQERLRKLIEADTTVKKADISPECRQLMETQRKMDKVNPPKKGTAPEVNQPATPAANDAAAGGPAY